MVVAKYEIEVTMFALDSMVDGGRRSHLMTSFKSRLLAVKDVVRLPSAVPIQRQSKYGTNNGIQLSSSGVVSDTEIVWKLFNIDFWNKGVI